MVIPHGSSVWHQVTKQVPPVDSACCLGWQVKATLKTQQLYAAQKVSILRQAIQASEAMKQETQASALQFAVLLFLQAHASRFSWFTTWPEVGGLSSAPPGWLMPFREMKEELDVDGPPRQQIIRAVKKCLAHPSQQAR